ncbi:hypothetical protein [Prescottella equi]|uniref:hypothetical protein n=1 Tax=Rhodococcus hoagii TaxID=43767 RepID=UPI003B76256B
MLESLFDGQDMTGLAAAIRAVTSRPAKWSSSHCIDSRSADPRPRLGFGELDVPAGT